MKRAARMFALALALWSPVIAASSADPPADRETVPIQETKRTSTLRAVYFPFLAVGHGLFFLVEYGVGYPVYYVFKPAIDFIYSSSDDPANYPNSVPSQRPPR
jgi:hypothetical protein